MNIRPVVVCLAVLFAGSLYAREKNDVIVMENGDRFTGEIKGLDAGVLRVSLDYVDGTISIEWSKVARLESSQLFVVQTEDGALYSGELTSREPSASQPVEIQVVESADTKIPIERSQLVKLDETSETFLNQLSADVNLGVVYSKGNNATQYSLGTDLEYRRERWNAEAAFNSSLSSSTGSTTSTRNQLTLSASRMWRDNYFYSGLGGFLQSSVQGIHLQTSLGGGIGKFLKNTNRTRISLLGGLIWQSTDYSPSTAEVPRQEVFGGVASAELKVFLFKKTNLSATVMLIPALSDPGRVYYNTNASYYLKFFGDFSWNFSFYGNWDTRPPPHFNGADYGYSSGITWSFNR